MIEFTLIVTNAFADSLTADNGGGMTSDKMRQCLSLGYSAKSKAANTIGQCELCFSFRFVCGKGLYFIYLFLTSERQ